ncbi:MAG TPA: RHS repeat-associated core domain-containing protein [Ktedonobacteraceae bacterium]|nr:RHS repeat-associated core domain-containing protein [Ktedonobacteraceae bacterium]
MPVSLIDVNNQQTTTAYTFDGGSANNDKHTITVSEPGECNGCYTKESNTYSSCAESIPTGTTAPCFEINDSTAEYASEVSSTFYDSLGRAVETSVPTASPNPGDGKAYFTVTITEYNDASATTWTSQPFVVAVTPGQGGVTGTGWLDPNEITDYNGHTPKGTTAFLDALGRTIAVRDPLYNTSSEPGVSCGEWLYGSYTACTNYSIGQINGGKSDPDYYITATGVDPNGHVGESFADTLGRTVYTEQFSGVSGGTLTAVQQTSMLYTILGQATQVQVQDLQPQTNQTITQVTTTASYDTLGRLLTLGDPDRGTHTYTYDPDGHVLSDVSSTRTLGDNYDLLGRLGCEQDAAPTINATGACTNGTHPYIQNSYDSSSVNWGSTDYPVGRLAQSSATTYYPGGSTMTTTENFEYDQRGRPITAQLSLSLPSAWGVATLPTYQMATDYTDADQPLTTITGTLVSGTLTKDSTTTQVYDGNSGVQVGLGTNPDSSVTNVASLVYNANALPDTITFYTSAGQSSSLATEQFVYDGDLRPAQTTATWQSGSGSSGQIYQEQRTYDSLGNVSSLATSLSTVPGKSNSGGTETQDFCYNEQNQLVWAGNSGTEPSPGNGTCGSAPLASGLTNAAYSNSFVYTHLGQLWKGPLNGSTTQYKYLYCSSGSNTPHQLTGIFPIGGGASCSNQTGAVYTSSYDAWGNVISRTDNGATTTLSYDLLDHLVEWNSGGTNREWYGYDANGQRTLERTLTGSGTTITVYAFGNEYTYNGSGTFQSSTHYYTLAGRLIGELTASPGQNTNIFVTDALGTVIATFSNVMGSAAVLANQVYGPYGTQRYKSGPMPTYTMKGFTGQYTDAVTGLDYYNARYYDPVAGVFLSADTVQGNLVGMNPYAYVDGNPETLSDPTGKMYAPLPGSGGGNSGDGGSGGGSPGTGQPNPTPPPVDPCNENSCGVTLNHHHYSLAELKKSVIERKNFLVDFYAQFDPGYGNAEEAFVNYLINCQRLTRSGYWNTVDFDVMRDQLLAAYDKLNGHTSQSTQVSGWLTFLAHPSSSSWWAAHNGSIDAGDQLARADGLFAKESGVEQHFINETIHVLSAVQSLSDKGITYFSPQSSGTATLTSWFYPQQYNDSSTAFSLIKQAGAALVIGETTGGVLGGPLGGFAGGATGLGVFFSLL